MGTLSTFFLSAYTGISLLDRLKSRVMLTATFVLGIGSLLYVVALIILEGNTWDTILYTAGAATTPLLFFLIKKGRITWASNVALLAALFILGISAFTSGRVSHYQGYTLLSSMVFVMILTCLL